MRYWWKFLLMPPIFTEVSRSSCSPSSPRWSPSQGCSCKGQALGQETPWITSERSTHTSGSLRLSLLDCSPPSSLSSFRPNRRRPCSFGVWWQPHHKCGWHGLPWLHVSHRLDVFYSSRSYSILTCPDRGCNNLWWLRSLTDSTGWREDHHWSSPHLCVTLTHILPSPRKKICTDGEFIQPWRYCTLLSNI